MPKFQCENEECVKHTEMDIEARVRFVWNPEKMKLESPYDVCPVCGGERKVFKDESIGMPWFKSEDSRNYNNKTIKKHDFDYQPSDDKPVKLSRENLQRASGEDSCEDLNLY